MIRRRYSGAYGGWVLGIGGLLLPFSPTPSTKAGQLQSRVTGGGGLQHVSGFAAANLADYYAVGPITEAFEHVPLQVSAGGGRAPYHVTRPWLDFTGVLDDQQAFGNRNQIDQRIDERGLAAVGAAGDENGPLQLDGSCHKLRLSSRHKVRKRPGHPWVRPDREARAVAELGSAAKL